MWEGHGNGPHFLGAYDLEEIIGRNGRGRGYSRGLNKHCSLERNVVLELEVVYELSLIHISEPTRPY